MPESTKSPAEVLIKARDAAMTVCVGFNEEGEDVYVGPNTAEEIASAVLKATGTIGLIEALDHRLLREVLGFVEDVAPDEVMASLRQWQDAQRYALRQASRRGGEA